MYIYKYIYIYIDKLINFYMHIDIFKIIEIILLAAYYAISWCAIPFF